MTTDKEAVRVDEAMAFKLDRISFLYGTSEVQAEEQEPLTMKSMARDLLNALLPVPEGGRWMIVEHFPDDKDGEPTTAYYEIDPMPAPFAGIGGTPRTRITTVERAWKIIDAIKPAPPAQGGEGERT